MRKLLTYGMLAAVAAMAAPLSAHAYWRHGPHGVFWVPGPRVVVGAPYPYYAYPYPAPVYYAPYAPVPYAPVPYAPVPYAYAPPPVVVAPPVAALSLRIR